MYPVDASEPPFVSIPWGRVGPLRDDWVRAESPNAADVVQHLLGLPGHTEVNATVLVIPVDVEGRSADLRLTLVDIGGKARAAEQRRPQH